MEFQEYARGLETISEEDFACILLRYTCLSESSVDEYLSRVRDRIAAAEVMVIVSSSHPLHRLIIVSMVLHSSYVSTGEENGEAPLSVCLSLTSFYDVLQCQQWQFRS